MWFQHDGAPPHFDVDVRRRLDNPFPGHWIGRGGPVGWPDRSPDLNPLDFFFWGHFKCLVYETPVDTDEDLQARILLDYEIRKITGVFERVQNSFLRRRTLCRNGDGDLLSILFCSFVCLFVKMQTWIWNIGLYQNKLILLLTLIVPRAWEIGFTQPCIKFRGKSATHFVYFWSRKNLPYTNLEATSYIPQQGQSLHIWTTSLSTTGCYKNRYTIQFLWMAWISRFAAEILSGHTELGLGSIRVKSLHILLLYSTLFISLHLQKIKNKSQQPDFSVSFID